MHILCQPNAVCTINCLCDKHTKIYSYVYFLNIQQLEYLEHHFMKIHLKQFLLIIQLI